MITSVKKGIEMRSETITNIDKVVVPSSVRDPVLPWLLDLLSSGRATFYICMGVGVSHTRAPGHHLRLSDDRATGHV